MLPEPRRTRPKEESLMEKLGPEGKNRDMDTLDPWMQTCTPLL